MTDTTPLTDEAPAKGTPEYDALMAEAQLVIDALVLTLQGYQDAYDAEQEEAAA